MASQVSKWACHKIECLADFIQEVSAGTKDGGCYVELFAGPGSYTCREAACTSFEGIEPRVLKIKHRFSRCIFIARDESDSQALAEVIKPLDNGHTSHIITGNCMRESVMRQVFDMIPRSTTSLVLVDPPGYAALRWSVIKKLAQHGVDWKGHKMDLLVLFPLEMALLRNLTRKECENSINRLYGNSAWQVVRQRRLENKLDLNKVRKELIELFKSDLKELGYKHVEDTEPARFSNPPYYHVIWASDRTSRAAELKETWGRERYLPCEMFHEGDKS
jgi:three-Cys-motif partner protein